jgi:hypothetical protein
MATAYEAPAIAPPAESIEDSLQRLEERLHRGWTLIEEGRAAGADVAELEDGWLRMLRRYERIHERLVA